MAEPAIDIDRIVQEVLRELRRLSDTPPSAAAPTAAPPAPAPASKPVAASETKPAQPSGQFVLTDRVITMSLLAGRLEGIHRVVVPPRAIVTPAVHDELRRRNVALTFARVESKPSSVQPLLLAMITTGTPFDPTPLTASLEATAVAVRHENLSCLIAASERLAGEVAGGAGLGLLLTRHTTAAICLANRHAGVRAVLASDVAATAAAVSGIGANVLVADPVALGLGRLKRIVLDYCRGGVRPCPKVFEKQLS